MDLRVRVLHCACAGEHHWYADIDDSGDPQPDDPYWFVHGCHSQSEALELACAQLSSLTSGSRPADSLARVQEARLVHV